MSRSRFSACRSGSSRTSSAYSCWNARAAAWRSRPRAPPSWRARAPRWPRSTAASAQLVIPLTRSAACCPSASTSRPAVSCRQPCWRPSSAHPQVEIRLRTFELTHPAAGLLDCSTDVAFVRPPVRAPGIKLASLAEEPRVFVLPAGHHLAGRDHLGLSDTAGLPWIAAETATDGCDPASWRDDWLVSPRPGGDQPVIGAVARTIDEWREYVVAGRGISLCPASAETFYARPGLAFVASRDVPPPYCA
jgi:LysR substrate binding domain